MIVCIAEKPSVAHDIAEVLGAKVRKEGYFEGNGYQVTWTFGHLCTLKEPHEYTPNWKSWSLGSLPMIPPRFGIKLISNPTYERQFHTIENLMQHAEMIINCGDAGQEGELIQRWVMQKAGAKCPVKRLWISSLTEEAIREGFAHLKDQQEFQPLYEAGLSRAIGDWTLGMNATRLYTLKYGQNKQVLSIGRVQTPTLALIVNRQKEIENFVPKQYWELKTLYRDTLFSAIVRKSDEELAEEAAQEKENPTARKKAAPKEDANRGIPPITDRKTGEELLQRIQNAPFTITDITAKKGTEAPPRLFDLTSLQVECNKKFSYSADMTLQLIQSLYEKKVATYPRVDTTFLSDDIYPKCPKILEGIKDYARFTAPLAGKQLLKSKKVFDNSKVTDHHAIIPTVEIARTDLSELPSGERDVLTLLAVRLLCATTQVHRFEAVTAILDCQGYTFTAKGKTILQSGWKEVERIHRMSIRQSETEHKENEAVALPVLQEGQTFEAVSASLREGKTSPPKHYTEDTLLSAMETAGAEDMPEDAERKGLGTPATRAATLEKLVSAGFVQRKKKQLIPTEKGKNLIAVLPDNIKSPILTAEWESMLKQVEHGELSATSFMDQIADMSRTLVKEHTTPEERFADLFPSSKGTAHEAVGVCPRCGAPVFEGKKGFFCGNRECSFALWKDNRFFSSKKKSITKSVAAALLKEGRISMSGLYSEKTGRTYDAEVILDDTGGKYVNFKLEFPVKKGRRK